MLSMMVVMIIYDDDMNKYPDDNDYRLRSSSGRCTLWTVNTFLKYIGDGEYIGDGGCRC